MRWELERWRWYLAVLFSGVWSSFASQPVGIRQDFQRFAFPEVPTLLGCRPRSAQTCPRANLRLADGWSWSGRRSSPRCNRDVELLI